MFKRFLPALSSSIPDVKNEETSFDIEVSSKRSDCSSEQINKSDIPTLRRRHSFVTPYAESVFEEEINRINGNADLSIDPFDTSNVLKRSKSLSFNISRRPSFSTLRKKPLKSVHFEPPGDLTKASSYCSKLKEVPTLDDTSVRLEKKKDYPEKSLSSFHINLAGKKERQNQLDHKLMEIYGSQDNQVQGRYSLFLDESIISELEHEDHRDNGDVLDDVLDDKSLPSVSDINYDPIREAEELEGSECDNSCLFTEYSQENKYDDNYIEDNLKVKTTIEKSIQEEKELMHNNEYQTVRAILQNLANIGNYKLENINYDSNHLSWQGILDYSEKANDANKLKDTELVQLKSQLKKHHCEKFEKENILQEECERLQNEFNSCKIANEQISAKYDLLLNLKNELETYEEHLKNDKKHLETDLSSYASRLQIEFDSRNDILALINKYDSGEKLLDKANGLKGYIEQVLLKNKSIVKENTLILEQKLRMQNEIASLEESLKSTLDRGQETLESITDENERLKASIEELKLKIENSDIISERKIEDQTKLLTEKDFHISVFSSQVAFLKEEKEYLQAKLSEYLADVEEANKQILEELVFRNQMEKDYNELSLRMKEVESLLNKQVKLASDQLSLKQSELLEVSDINSRMKQQIVVLQADLKSVKEDKEQLVGENQSFVRDNADYQLALDLLQEHIKKSNKNVDIMSEEYLLVLKSNEIISNAIKRFAGTIFQSMQPVMYEESRIYFTQIYSELVKQTLFSQDQINVIESVSQFITRCISDIVCQYLENEMILQSEVENRNNNYQKMLDKLTRIMEDSILRVNNSKENNIDIGIVRNLQVKHKTGTENRRRGIIYKNPNQ